MSAYMRRIYDRVHPTREANWAVDTLTKRTGVSEQDLEAAFASKRGNSSQNLVPRTAPKTRYATPARRMFS